MTLRSCSLLFLRPVLHALRARAIRERSRLREPQPCRPVVIFDVRTLKITHIVSFVNPLDNAKKLNGLHLDGSSHSPKVRSWMDQDESSGQCARTSTGEVSYIRWLNPLETARLRSTRHPRMRRPFDLCSISRSLHEKNRCRGLRTAWRKSQD